MNLIALLPRKMELADEPEKTGGLKMDERRPVPPFGDARKESVSRLLDAFAEYERTVALLRTAVLRLCLPGTDQGMDDADGPGANRTARGNRTNG